MTAADRVLMVLLLAALPWLYVATWSSPGRATALEIRVADAEPVTENLHKDRTIEVNGFLGTSRVEIRDRQARFTASPCPNKLCIHTGWLEAAGELAACLPNRVSIRLLGRIRQFDSINF